MKHSMKLIVATVMAGLAVTAATGQAADPVRRLNNAPVAATAEAATAPFTIEQVKTILAGHLLMQRSDLTVGTVRDKDAFSYEAELLGADGTVARYLLIDRQSGRPGGLGPCPMGMSGGMGGPGSGMMPGMGRGPHGAWGTVAPAK